LVASGTAGNVFGTGTANHATMWTSATTVGDMGNWLYDNSTGDDILQGGTLKANHARLNYFDSYDGLFQVLTIGSSGASVGLTSAGDTSIGAAGDVYVSGGSQVFLTGTSTGICDFDFGFIHKVAWSGAGFDPGVWSGVAWMAADWNDLTNIFAMYRTRLPDLVDDTYPTFRNVGLMLRNDNGLYIGGTSADLAFWPVDGGADGEEPGLHILTGDVYITGQNGIYDASSGYLEIHSDSDGEEGPGSAYINLYGNSGDVDLVSTRTILFSTVDAINFQLEEDNFAYMQDQSLSGGTAGKKELHIHALGSRISMNTNKIVDLGAATTAGDAVRYEQLFGAFLPLAGGTMTGSIAMGTHKITGLGNGSASDDAAAFGQILNGSEFNTCKV
jgi:hypothetical protein